MISVEFLHTAGWLMVNSWPPTPTSLPTPQIENGFNFLCLFCSGMSFMNSFFLKGCLLVNSRYKRTTHFSHSGLKINPKTAKYIILFNRQSIKMATNEHRIFTFSWWITKTLNIWCSFVAIFFFVYRTKWKERLMIVCSDKHLGWNETRDVHVQVVRIRLKWIKCLRWSWPMI